METQRHGVHIWHHTHTHTHTHSRWQAAASTQCPGRPAVWCLAHARPPGLHSHGASHCAGTARQQRVRGACMFVHRPIYRPTGRSFRPAGLRCPGGSHMAVTTDDLARQSEHSTRVPPRQQQRPTPSHTHTLPHKTPSHTHTLPYKTPSHSTHTSTQDSLSSPAFHFLLDFNPGGGECSVLFSIHGVQPCYVWNIIVFINVHTHDLFIPYISNFPCILYPISNWCQLFQLTHESWEDIRSFPKEDGAPIDELQLPLS